MTSTAPAPKPASVAVEGLHDGFLRSVARHAGRPALEINGEPWTYADLFQRAAAVAATLQRHTPSGGAPLAAVFASRSATTYAGILGALLAGRGYVPLNRQFPVARTRAVLRRADTRALVVDAGSLPQLDAILDGISEPLLIVLPDTDDVSGLVARWPEHTIRGRRDLEPSGAWTPAPVDGDAGAYLLFTSGSTGTPKGVLITHRNVRHFVRAMTARYGFTAEDRFSQLFDTTFDLSVLDMFLAWESGACVCCPDQKSLANPASFVRQQRLTVWCSVPSVAVLMKRFGGLKGPGFESLRWSLFCGEPLPVDVAAAWARAAAASTVDNLYGPTEVTVACSSYRWDANRAAAEARLGIVPIGEPFAGMSARVVDDAGGEVAPGDTGELWVSGPQVASGYWRDADATARAFVTVAGSAARFYRTGDLVRRPVDGGPLTFVGRVDHQIKVLGHRIELGEVESHLRESDGVAAAVAVGWPLTEAGAAGVVAFVTGADVDAAAVRARLAGKLPAYAVPHEIYVVPELPYTANGKIDRQALLRELSQ